MGLVLGQNRPSLTELGVPHPCLRTQRRPILGWKQNMGDRGRKTLSGRVCRCTDIYLILHSSYTMDGTTYDPSYLVRKRIWVWSSKCFYFRVPRNGRGRVLGSDREKNQSFLPGFVFFPLCPTLPTWGWIVWTGKVCLTGTEEELEGEHTHRHSKDTSSTTTPESEPRYHLPL